MEVKIKRLCDEASIPQYAHATDAGMDLVATSYEYNEKIHCHIYGTGIAVEIPEGYEGQVRGRSGLNSKGIKVAIGTIESEYRGDVGIITTNHSLYPFEVKAGMRLAQFTIKPVYKIHLVEEVELSDTERGTNGYGSSGV